LTRGDPPTLDGLRVFAVEDTAVQLTWRDGRPGSVLRVGDHSVVVGRAGPGATSIDGLAPATRYDVVVDGRPAGAVRTLAPPPGELLFRFATVSDTHIGERGFGILPRFHEDSHLSERDAYPNRCLRAAIDEAAAWGAQLLVAKGDLTWSGRPLQWETVAETLAAAPIPVHATLGNHDVVPRAVDGRDVLTRHGVVAARTVEPVDVPGLRIVLGHSADRGHRYGVVDGVQRDEIVRLVAESTTPAFVTLHHYVNPLPVRSRYPRGIEHTEGDALIAGLAAVQPATFLSFGHSHRNRRKVRHGLPLTEVGSTKDYPGVWAGYAVHEGGIRQVVRRVAEPSCLEWTEPTRAVLGGFWGWWSPGRLRWRSFTWTWPTP
jgi:3',5'-cyclic-AMP phosphodiesterase